MPAHQYQLTPKAFKQLQKLPQTTQQRIIRKLDFYCQKDPINYADKLTNYLLGSFRFRIGNYRVIFDLLENNTLLILLIGHRRDIYR